MFDRESGFDFVHRFAAFDGVEPELIDPHAILNVATLEERADH